MDRIKILVTGAGAPGIYGTIQSLIKNPEKRKFDIITVDVNQPVPGAKFSKKFYRIPYPDNTEFIDKILEICKREKVEIILPQVTKELPVFAENKKIFEENGITPIISEKKAIDIANNKRKLLKFSKSIGLTTPKFLYANSLEEIKEAIYELGYPNKRVIIKPSISSGMRGFRIISEKQIKRDFFGEKPYNTTLTIKQLEEIFEDKGREMLIMEYLPGEEYSVDTLSYKNQPIIISPRKRCKVRSGVSFDTILEKNEKIIEKTNILLKKIGLQYINGFQYILSEKEEPMLIESNPRIQGTMIATIEGGANIIYDSIKIALGEEPISKQDNIKWGTRIIRYWGWVRFNH